MSIMSVVLLIDTQLAAIVFIWATILSHGVPGNNSQFPAQAQNPNIIS